MIWRYKMIFHLNNMKRKTFETQCEHVICLRALDCRIKSLRNYIFIICSPHSDEVLISLLILKKKHLIWAQQVFTYSYFSSTCLRANKKINQGWLGLFHWFSLSVFIVMLLKPVYTAACKVFFFIFSMKKVFPEKLNSTSYSGCCAFCRLSGVACLSASKCVSVSMSTEYLNWKKKKKNETVILEDWNWWNLMFFFCKKKTFFQCNCPDFNLSF